jgi:hypothetical protein
MRSRIEPMKKVAKTVLGHRELIFRTFPVIELALYHALGKLPEPNVAHRFY